MVFSYYINRPIYAAAWYFLRIFRGKKRCVLYCEDAFDILLFKNVGRHLGNVEIVAKNKSVRSNLKKLGYEHVSTMPSFPDAVIMFRNMAWKFPCKKIVKIGFKHGAYNFKAHSKAQYYNMFNLFFLTSNNEAERVKKSGVTAELAAAYPKIDSIFDGSITADHLKELSEKIGLDPDKKTLLFSSTWDGSGMSAIDKWYDKISSLKSRFNLLVTVHDWMSGSYKNALRENRDIFFIEELDRIKYIMLADVCVNDTSSLIAECCLLNKPLVTFKTAQTSRTLPDVIELIEKISLRIDRFDELEGAVDLLLKNGGLFAKERAEAAKIMFDTPDGLAGKRAAEKIVELVPELKKQVC
ncbi:MAG: CDP-glycerol glycerophosphotransferase family protein [Chitinispirillales bacterium]|jgi:hypothetical protein|nr:CDP-glycerol glycerophosphotransferase family protein [Chitinispirillales bacterium]